MSASGHSVLLVPVPELEWFVRARWQHYDPEWVAPDPDFTHAHITALAPYLPDPTAEDLRTVGEIAAATPPFDYRLAEVAAFENGCLHLPPEPAAPFADLTRLLAEAFPQCPPYAGEYDVAPHLTLDQTSSTVSVASTRAAVGQLPVYARADRLELHWYAAGECHVRHRWPLGEPSGPDAMSSMSRPGLHH